MRAAHAELVQILTDLTALPVVPQGSDLPGDLFVSYLFMPGGVDRAHDGGGPYLSVIQLDVWCRAHGGVPDPEEMTFSVSEQIVEHVKGLARFGIRQMPSYTEPSEENQGYARALLKLSATYSL